jgi:hypothetical protein
MVRNAWRHAEYSWFPLPTPAAGDNDDTESDDESVNAADNADNKLNDDEEELEENTESNNESSSAVFSRQTAVSTKLSIRSPQPFTKKKEKDKESSSHLFSSSESDNKSVLPSTHDFVAALESNASNQETGNNDSQLTTTSF